MSHKKEEMGNDVQLATEREGDASTNVNSINAGANFAFLKSFYSYLVDLEVYRRENLKVFMSISKKEADELS